MLKASRLFVAAIALALVLVPTITRAQQRVARRDATRMSIKHSWIGVAPPTKALIPPQQIVVVPAIGADPEPPRVTTRLAAPVEPALHPVPAVSPDLLRGPPPAPFLFL
jgi:hypothetical protein